MTFGATSLRDTFNRANENPAAGWTAVYNSWQVSSNVAQPNNAAGVLAYFTAVAAVADAEAWFTITTKPANNEAVTAFARILDSGSVATVDGYLVSMTTQSGTDEVRIQRVTNAVATTLGSVISQEFAVGDGLGIRVVGTSIEAWHRSSGTWTMLGSRIDSTYTAAGRIGATTGGGTTARIDDFGGGAYVFIPLTASVTATTVALKTVSKLLFASITATANALRTTAKNLTASVTGSTDLSYAKSYFVALTASLTATATLLKTAVKNLSASETPTATVLKTTNKNLSASSTPTATLLRTILKVLSASVTATAAAKKTAQKNTSASLTPTTVIVKTIQKNMSASSQPTTTLIKTTLKKLSASVTPSKLLERLIANFIALTASVGATTQLTKHTYKNLSASVNPAKALQIIGSYFIALAASLTASATLRKTTQKKLSSSVTPTAVSLKTASKNLSASMTAQTTLLKSIFKRLNASVTPTAISTNSGLAAILTPLWRTYRILARLFEFTVTDVREYFIEDDDTMQFETSKSPAERLDYKLDFTGWLQDDEIITASEWEVPEDSGLVIDPNTEFDITSATLWLTDGTVSRLRWPVVNKITTSNGRISENTLLFSIRG